MPRESAETGSSAHLTNKTRKDNMTKTPHKHAEAIRAWANGDEIEFRAPDTTAWVWSPAPAWVEDYEYRVKPARVYPLWMASDQKIRDICALQSSILEGTRRVVSTAIREMVDGGVLVTRKEFDCAVGDRDKRDMEVAKHVRHKCYTSSQQAIGKLDLEVIVQEVSA